jgi:hypothetical protein
VAYGPIDQVMADASSLVRVCTAAADRECERYWGSRAWVRVPRKHGARNYLVSGDTPLPWSQNLDARFVRAVGSFEY